MDNNKEGGPLYFSTKYARLVPDIIWCMRKLKLADEIIFYLEWDNMVQKKFTDKISKENYTYEGGDYITFLSDMQDIFYETVLEELPAEFNYLIDELKDKTFNDYWNMAIKLSNKLTKSLSTVLGKDV